MWVNVVHCAVTGVVYVDRWLGSWPPVLTLLVSLLCLRPLRGLL